MTPQGQQTLRQELDQDEGYRTKVYFDAGGVPTVGRGHTGPDVRPGATWSTAEIEAAFTSDIRRAEQSLYKALPWTADLDDPRQDVLVDMTFNLGLHGLLGFHRFLTAVQDGNYAQAGEDLLATHPWVDQVGDRAKRLAAQIEQNVHLPPHPPAGNAGTAAALARAV